MEAVLKTNAKPALIGPTPEQIAKGDYVRKFVMNAESATEAMAHVSKHDPVSRWKAAGRLTDGQSVAIDHVRRLWELSGLRQAVTANYGVPGGQGSSELRAATEIDARHDLHRMQEYIPLAYWSVFENVCRWGEPAGVAGSSLGFGSRSGNDRAHTIVCFVADIVAMKERL